MVETAAREGGEEEYKKWNSRGLGLFISKRNERMGESKPLIIKEMRG